MNKVWEYIYKRHSNIPLANDNSILGYQSSSPAILQCVRISKIPKGSATSAKNWATSLQHISRCSRQMVGLPMYAHNRGVGTRPEGKKGRHKVVRQWPGAAESPCPHVGSLPQSQVQRPHCREKGPPGISPPDALQDITDTSLHLSFSGDVQSSPNDQLLSPAHRVFPCALHCICSCPVTSMAEPHNTKTSSQFRSKSTQPSKITASGHHHQHHQMREQSNTHSPGHVCSHLLGLDPAQGFLSSFS